ncbi:MAG: hypothetical protein ABR956_05510 [Terracidiphilus sp.]|jgi:hypothetical protein
MASLFRGFCAVLLLAKLGVAFADPAPFDLTGPKLAVKVTHKGATLPISEVPNLAEGDQLWIKADLPPGQSARYLMVTAFLRGATNPPPEHWFHASETWKNDEGVRVTVPENAQQVLVFLAPETGGDFKTLVNAVRGRPGSFVRASQDLNQTTLDRSRLDVYLAAIRKLGQSDPAALKTASPLLARSLTIKVNMDCLERMPELQGPCLMQGQDSLILNDGHSTSIVQALTTGNAGDLAMQLSSTPQAGYGYFSPYVASVVDIARILDSLHTAQYQYIPALATEHDDHLSLLLNTAPSFHNPKSVLVAALPAVEPPQMPPLHPVDPKEVYCAEKTELVLPAEGAPLAFATAYAHGMVLSLTGKNGRVVELPVKADAVKGGFVANTASLSPVDFGDAVDGSLHGYWGFEPYDGPEFRLENVEPQHWKLADGDQESLVVGRDDTVHLEAQATACVDSIMLQASSGNPEKAEWKPTKPNEVTVTVPLKKANPGSMTLLVKQYGSKDTESVPLKTFAQAGHLDSFTIHAGDRSGMLKGARLDQVETLTLDGASFKPGTMAANGSSDEVPLVTSDGQAVDKLKAGESATVKVALKDGRVVNFETRIEPPRPRVTLISKSVQPASDNLSNIQLASQDEIPQNAQLTFSVHAQSPAAFSGHEKIEVGTVQGAFLATLTVAGGLTLVDAQVAMATLDTAKAFGGSASGPIRFRVVEDGVEGDWIPLATLVRLPVLRDLKCPAASDLPCKLSGPNLFLVDSISNDPKFDHPVQIAEGFTGDDVAVPHPIDGQLYVKLRDDPAVVNSVAFTTQTAASSSSGTPIPPSAAQAQNSQISGAKPSSDSAATADSAAPGNGASVTAPSNPSHAAGEPVAPTNGKTTPQSSALPAPSAPSPQAN